MALVSVYDLKVNADMRTNDRFLALAARLAIAPSTWIFITALSIITISVRADMREISGGQAFLYVGISVMVVPVVVSLVGLLLKVWHPQVLGVVILAVIAWVVAGLGRIGAESFLAHFWNLSDPILGFNVYFAQLVTLPIWAAILGTFGALNIQLLNTIDEQSRLISRLRMSTEERWNELTVEREVLARQVAESIKPQIGRISELLDKLKTNKPSVELGNEIHQVAEQCRDLVRRSSRETAELAQRRQDLVEAKGRTTQPLFIGLWPIQRPTAPWPPATGASLLALSVTMLPIAAASGSVTLFLVIAVALITVAINRLLWTLIGSRFRHLSEPLAWLAISFVNVASPLIAYFGLTTALSRIANMNFFPRLPVAAFSMLFLGGVMITLAQIWSRDRKQLRDHATAVNKLGEELAELDADTRIEYERVCQQTSRLLHGPIQGRLAAVSMSLAMSSSDGQRIPSETLAVCRGLVDACLSDLDQMMQVDKVLPPIEVSLRELRRRWTGLLDIRWSFNNEILAELDRDATLRSKVEDFLGDCATNACRHGAARNLEFRCGLNDLGLIELSAEDDGRGLDQDFEPGSGLSTLGTFGVNWSIANRSGGGCLVRYWPIAVDSYAASRRGDF